MQRIQDPAALTTRPATPVLTGPVGYFTNGNPASAQAATPVPDWWLNMNQEELCAILVAAGLPVDGTASVLQALQGLFVPRGKAVGGQNNTNFTPVSPAAGQPAQTTSIAIQFTAQAPGLVIVVGAANVLSPQPIACGHYVGIDANSFPANQSTLSQTHFGVYGVMPGSHQVASSYGCSPGSSATFVPVELVVGYLFLPLG